MKAACVPNAAFNKINRIKLGTSLKGLSLLDCLVAVKVGHTHKMRVVSAYLLAVLGGNASPSAADIEKICQAGGVSVEGDRVATFLKEVEGKNLEELLEAGRGKLASMPAGGAAPAAGGGGGGGGDAAAPAAEEKKVEEESEDEDMGFDLFD
eukprot:jgi/Ulvmu1/9188/UM005_0288.1